MRCKAFLLILAICITTACAIPNHKVKIVLVGDSTVTDKAGWGHGFKRYLTDRAVCFNTAAGGRSSKSFIRENRWDEALKLKGDYYLIQFGHNDEPNKGDRATDPNTTYREFMTRYVDDARAIGATPVLVTSLTRRQWDKSGNGKINSSLVPYVEAVKAIAKEKNVPLVDLHASSIKLCEKSGKEKCIEWSPIKNGSQVDGTHLNSKGSVVFAKLVIDDLVRVAPELKPCFRKEPVAEIAAQKIYDVRQLGAKGDGKTLDTEAIQKALDECGKTGGGIVQLPAGTYLCKPLFMRSATTLKLDEGAVLKATDDPKDFADPQRPRNVIAFINGQNLNNVTITGKGTINGSGQRWWPAAREAKLAKQPETQRRPRMIVITNCVDLRIEGVTLTNSPTFHLIPRDCENVDIDNVKFISPDESPNTDAIDPSTSRHVRITNCHIDVGDDNVAIKSGKMDSAHPNAACEDITVADCKFFHGHGMSIGSETTGGVKSLKVERILFDQTESGVRIKSDRTRGGIVENLSYSDLTMNNVNAPINITMYYPKVPPQDTSAPADSKTPVYRNIRITNLTATSSKNAGFIVGLPESLITDVVLENVTIKAPKGLTIRNAKVTLKNVKIEVQEGPPFILQNNAEVTGLDQTK